MGFFEIALIIATFLCSLVTGFLFAFAVVVMPGIRSLKDREFISAFQEMDRVIQNNQPIFMLAWLGSVIALIAAAVLGVSKLYVVDSLLIILATLIYIFGVQLPTITVNIPLNNRLQSLDADALNEPSLKTARGEFEPRWNKWNLIRTALSSLVSVMLIILLFRL